MTGPETYVSAQIDVETRDSATAALASMGLSISDAIRLLLNRVASEQTLPPGLEVPNIETRKAMAETERGEAKRFDTVEDLMADLHAEY